MDGGGLEPVAAPVVRGRQAGEPHEELSKGDRIGLASPK